MSGFYDYRGAPYPQQPQQPAGLAEYPLRYAAQLAWAIESQKDKNDWTTLSDWAVGNSDLCRIQWELIMGTSVERIIGASDRIYALLDATLNAVPRTGTYNSTTGVTIFTPPIPAGPGLIAVKALEPRHNEAYAEALAQGLSLDAIALELSEIKALLAALDAEQTAEDLTEIIARLGAILALL